MVEFWKEKTLEEMTSEEWESLCDGCAKCCLVKARNARTGVVCYSNVACHLLDHNTCRCTDYQNRSELVSNCITLTPAEIRAADWLPKSCGYKLVENGKDLEWWHHLKSGDRMTVHLAGQSVREVIKEPLANG